MSKAIIKAMEERLRQVNEEGFTAERDDAYPPGKLASAAECYARAVFWSQIAPGVTPPIPLYWPFDEAWWKPSEDPQRNIIKAMALLAAEYDRIERAEAAAASISQMPDLAYSTNSEEWECDDLVQFALDKELCTGDEIYEGDVVRHKGSDFTKGVVDMSVLDYMRDRAWDEGGEASESYLDDPLGGSDDLLQALVNAWADAYTQPNFYRVENVRSRIIKAEDVEASS